MRVTTLVIVFACCGACAIAAGQPPATAGQSQPKDDSADERSGMEAAGRRWAKQGVQVSQTVDDLAVFTLEGKSVKLASMWKDRPALIVTASLTCPVARERCPKLESLVDAFDPEVRVVMLYTIEAHPKGDDSPYSPGREWVTADNEKYGVLHAQPTTLDERLKLARELHARVGEAGLMLVDAMDNQAWQMLGGGPNLAVLVNSDGRVIAKQGWFDPPVMRQTIEALLKQRVSLATEAYEIGKHARPRMDAFVEALRSDDRETIDGFYAADARGWFNQKTGPGTPIASSPWRAWDEELNARHTIESARIQGNEVTVVSTEVNDFARLIGFAGWRATTTYWFDHNGRITEKLYRPMEVKPCLREQFAPALDWARQHKAEELKAIYPNNDFAPSADTAKRWRDVLVEWRKATGRPAIDLELVGATVTAPTSTAR